MEEAHRDLTAHLRPGSPVAVSLLELACFQFAAERWREEQGADARDPRRGAGAAPAHEDAEALLSVVTEMVLHLCNLARPGEEEDEEEEQAPGIVDVKGLLTTAHAELKRECAQDAPTMMAVLLPSLLELVHLRRRLGNAAYQVLTLERMLKAQANACGARIENLASLRPRPRDVVYRPSGISRIQFLLLAIILIFFDTFMV